MIDHDWNLFYDIYNKINEHNHRQADCLSSIVNYNLFLSALKSSPTIASASSLVMIWILSLFECITLSLSLSSLEEIKSVVIVNWISYVSDVSCLLNMV